ncbi:MAG: 1,4-alpha-glucan branching protein [Chitinophagaceae bacterium]|nr:MAG: 1,4-alpha-glucan branching protein [Chitinophagaceae bacterium]
MKDRQFKAVSWSVGTNIYEVNLRQYTVEGTFQAFASHLPRLKDMGVEILWFMPVTPISREKRLGILGSYYACSDYTGTNPEFGTVEDFTNLVAEAHKHGFKVIIDWVANHTGWDHVWTKTDPGFYKRNKEGNFYDSHGWEDVIDLNYYDHKLRREMVKAMKFWIDTCNIDGFRCDMAHLVPLDFWRNARTELDAIKPLFWLAETDDAHYFEVFDAGYAWNWMHSTEKHSRDQIQLEDVMTVLYQYEKQYPVGSRHLFFTSNHDENSWNGTEYEKYGEAARALVIFSYTWKGIPMTYSGQEIPNLKRLKFFEKDHIEWPETCALHEFYKTLNQFRKDHPVFREYPASFPKRIHTNHDRKSLCYSIGSGEDELIIGLSFSPDAMQAEFAAGVLGGLYRSVLDNRVFDFSKTPAIDLKPWDAIILQKEPK